VTRLARRVEPERLDSLPATDPAAIHSRRDLQRLNCVMGQAAAIARLLERRPTRGEMRRLADLGGGDGTLLLQVARRLAPRRKAVEAVVVDRQALVSERTRQEFARLGWGIESATADAREWLAGIQLSAGTVILANLFLHHFNDEPLRALLDQISTRSESFVACEPRRTSFTFGAARLVGWIGCNEVTRYDAKVSVRAGFIGREISALWPAGEGWDLEEGRSGLFSHYFVAARRDGSRLLETRGPR
jgi:hypothetical protein